MAASDLRMSEELQLEEGDEKNAYVIVDIVLDNFLWMWEYQTP